MPGGGVALLRSGEALDGLRVKGDEKIGVEIVKNALSAPIKQIVDNGGIDGSVVADEVLEKASFNYGFDAKKREFCDLVKAGVIDPAKVARVALESAASVAGLLLTTEVLVTDLKEDDKAVDNAVR